jgi:hypothetical protein
MIKDRLETVRLFPQRFARPRQSCLEDSLVLVLGGYSEAAQVCACTLRFGGRRCMRWQACPYCAYRRERTAFDRFAPVAVEWRRCCSVTICPEVGPEEGVEADLVVLLDLWDQLHEVALALVRNGSLAGMWWGEHFVPHFHCGGRPAINCWPHLHGLAVLPPGSGAEDVESVIGARVHCESLSDETHFKNLLDYVVAVPAYAGAYREAWLAVGGEVGSAVAADLNHAVSDVIGVFEDASNGRQKFRTAGVMHPRNRRFVGAVSGGANARATATWISGVNSRSAVDVSCD